MKATTVKELYDELEWCVKNGYGNKRVLISRDDEWNGFHEVYYGVMEDTDDVVNNYFGSDYKDVVLIG